jgi:hypothetical protein
MGQRQKRKRTNVSTFTHLFNKEIIKQLNNIGIVWLKICSQEFILEFVSHREN